MLVMGGDLCDWCRCGDSWQKPCRSSCALDQIGTCATRMLTRRGRFDQVPVVPTGAPGKVDYDQWISCSLCSWRSSAGGLVGTPIFSWSASSFSSHCTWLLKTAPKFRAMDCTTFSTGILLPNSFVIDVTGFDLIPQVMIRLK